MQQGRSNYLLISCKVEKTCAQFSELQNYNVFVFHPALG
jgi:hypothetical protein